MITLHHASGKPLDWTDPDRLAAVEAALDGLVHRVHTEWSPAQGWIDVLPVCIGHNCPAEDWPYRPSGIGDAAEYGVRIDRATLVGTWDEDDPDRHPLAALEGIEDPHWRHRVDVAIPLDSEPEEWVTLWTAAPTLDHLAAVTECLEAHGHVVERGFPSGPGRDVATLHRDGRPPRRRRGGHDDSAHAGLRTAVPRRQLPAGSSSTGALWVQPAGTIAGLAFRRIRARGDQVRPAERILNVFRDRSLHTGNLIALPDFGDALGWEAGQVPDVQFREAIKDLLDGGLVVEHAAALELTAQGDRHLFGDGDVAE